MVPRLGWRRLVLALTFALVLLADQVTKFVVRSLVVDGFWSMPFLPGFMRFEFVANRGASFGMGEGFGFLFALLAIAVFVAVVWYSNKVPYMSKVELLGLGMLLGGAIGNMIDRIAFGYVTDFLCTEFIDFPVFNVADIGITCGVVLAFIGFMFLSPANKIDAAAALNRRDAQAKSRRPEKKAGR